MRKKQHPLILAMNKFDALFTDLDDASYEAFTAYVQDQVSTRRRNRAVTHPKSPSPAANAGQKSRKLKEFQLDGGASSATEKEIATSVGGSGD